MKSGRPSVRLTVARMQDGERLTPLQIVELDRVLHHHKRPITAKLVYACLECGTIGEAEDQLARDGLIDALGRAAFECCSAERTITFYTERI